MDMDNHSELNDDNIDDVCHSDFASDHESSDEYHTCSDSDGDSDVEMRCTMCDGMFYSLDDLKRHMRKRHNKASAKTKKKRGRVSNGVSVSNSNKQKEEKARCSKQIRVVSDIRICTRCTYIAINATEYARHRDVCVFDVFVVQNMIPLN